MSNKGPIRIKKDDRRKYDEFMADMEELKSRRVKIGLLEGETRDDGLSLAGIGAVHEYGSSDGRIPERSFLRAYVDGNRGALRKIFAQLARKVSGQEMSAGDAMKTLGVYAVGEVRRFITNMSSPPLKPQTIARKGSSKVLIDTGQLRAGINYKVEGK